MRSSRSTAKMPMLIDSTIFSWNSFSLSNSVDLLLQPSVELRVLDSDADVAGQRLQHLHVFAGEKIAVVGAAQADHRNRSGARRPRDSPRGRAGSSSDPERPALLPLRARADAGPAADSPGRDGCSHRAVEVEEAHIERAQLRSLQIGQAVRGSQIEVPRVRRPSPLRARNTATRVTSSVCGSRSTIESSRARRSVCEFRPRPKSTSVSR